jgi:hypothetical protein
VKHVVIHSEARAELDAAMEFYESRAAGLALDLQAEVKEAAAKSIASRLRFSTWSCRIAFGLPRSRTVAGVLIIGDGGNAKKRDND